MLTFPNIDPVAVHLGPLSIHWYGLMYLVAFLGWWSLLRIRIQTSPRGFSPEQLSDLLFYGAMGVIIGGRLGYMLFYALNDAIHSPWQIFMVWRGGMSFHGGLIGVMLALFFYAYRTKKPLLDVWDFVAPAAPIGLAAGRIGNFINAEIWGRVTDVPWGIVFPNAGDLPRHPSQLYEFFLEGIVLFIVLWFFSMKTRPRGAVSGLFLVLYGLFRISVEFFREPDVQKGYIALGWVTEGQLLSLPMIVFGMLLLVWAYNRGRTLCNNI